MKKLDSKNIIVTGGSLGIGLAVSKKIASEGGTVIMLARNVYDLQTAIGQLKQLYNSNHYYYSVNISEKNEIEKFKNSIKNKFEEIHGLVNCAGIYGPIGKTTSINSDDILNTIKINLMGTIYMCSMFANLNSINKRKIINFSGGGAATSFPNYSAYATSKTAIVRLTENLSIELCENNIDINCVAPGFVITRLHNNTLEAGPDKAGKNFFENTQKQIKNGAISSEKAADLTSFLLSEDSDGITGKFISAPWDNWQDETFQKLLRDDKDFATLRRIDNKTFFKK
jgi:NAD(P)-dependent dehydrogenase (short-subunit alcohol dehydrogenase family)